MNKKYDGNDFSGLADLYVETTTRSSDEVISENTEILVEKTREFQTYSSWKAAVKKIDSEASFTGDKDIDGATKKGQYDAEWDGAKGKIVTEACKKEPVKEDDEEDDEEVTESKSLEELTEEGMLDRMKAGASAYMGAAKDRTKGAIDTLKGRGAVADQSVKSRKAKAILDIHFSKFEKILSDLATDLVKMGVLESDAAEDLASNAVSLFKSNPKIANTYKTASKVK